MKKFRGDIQISFRYSRCLGPRSHIAGVSLKITNGANYEFINAANWIEYDFGNIVEKGIKDGLIEIGLDPDLGINILLENVEYDPINSSEHSFYVAAKSAAKSISAIAEQ